MEILKEAFGALWQVLAIGLLLGAGLPALFAVGMRSLAAGREVAADGATLTGEPSLPGRIGATVAFGFVGLAVILGIVVIVFGDQLFG
ncbi:MAG: hypothetical protein ACTH2Q_10860 [Propionibacteriaceae bacterium]